MSGYNTIIDAHIGDYGSNMSVFMDYFTQNKKEIDDTDIQKLSHIYSTYKDDYNENKINLIEYEKHIYNTVLTITKKEIHKALDQTNTRIDLYNSEYNYVHMCKYFVQKYLQEGKVYKNKKQQFVIKSEHQNKQYDLVIQKSNNIPMYSFTEIMCMYERNIIENYYMTIYVVDNRQKQHIEVCKSAFEQLNNKTINTQNILFGIVCTENGILSSRTLNCFTVDDIYKYIYKQYGLEKELCMNIIKLYILKHNFDSNITITNKDICTYSNIHYKFNNCINKTTKLNISNKEINNIEKELMNNVWKIIEYINLVSQTHKNYNIHNYVYNCMKNHSKNSTC